MFYYVNNAPSQVLLAAYFKEFFRSLRTERTYFHSLVFLLEDFLQYCIRMETVDIYHNPGKVRILQLLNKDLNSKGNNISQQMIPKKVFHSGFWAY